jgi:hypothetical protein
MTNLGVLAITLSANILFLFKFGALLEAESRLGGLRAEALRIERVHGQARLRQVAQKEELGRRMAEAEVEIHRAELAIEEYRSRTATTEANIEALTRQIDEASSLDQSLNAYLTEHGKACAVLLRSLNAKQTVAVPQDHMEIGQFRELLRVKNLERKFEALNDMALILGRLSLYEKSAGRLSHFYNGWLMETLGDEFPKDERVRLALERRFGESIQIGVGVILKPVGERDSDALRTAVFDEIDESILNVLADANPDYKERLRLKVMSLNFQDPMIENVYKPLCRAFSRE